MKLSLNIFGKKRTDIMKALRAFADSLQAGNEHSNCFIPDNGEGYEMDYSFTNGTDVSLAADLTDERIVNPYNDKPAVPSRAKRI